MTPNEASPSPALVVRAANAADGAAIRLIDEAGIATGHATFRAEPYDWNRWHATYAAGTAFGRVAQRDGRVVGWAGVVPMSDRCTYSGVGEVSVYVAAGARGGGVGTALLAEIVRLSEERGYWTLVAQCFPENEASVGLHKRQGFVALGLRQRLGRMRHGPFAGRWRDVLMMERRSDRVGT